MPSFHWCLFPRLSVRTVGLWCDWLFRTSVRLRWKDALRLLVIEDDRQLTPLLKKGLAAWGYQLDVAHDAEMGSYLAESGAYDAIITAVLLPEKNGTTLCRDLRQHGVMTPILMLTARDALAEKVGGSSPDVCGLPRWRIA